MSSALTTLESRLSAAWGDLRTDAQADLREALADAKAELAQAKTDAGQIGGTVRTQVVAEVQPLLTAFEGAVKVAVEAAEPGVQSTVTSLAAKLLADVAKVAL